MQKASAAGNSGQPVKARVGKTVCRKEGAAIQSLNRHPEQWTEHFQEQCSWSPSIQTSEDLERKQDISRMELIDRHPSARMSRENHRVISLVAVASKVLSHYFAQVDRLSGETGWLGQLGSIPALVLPSGGMAVRHRKGATTGGYRLLSDEERCLLEKGLDFAVAKRVIRAEEIIPSVESVFQILPSMEAEQLRVLSSVSFLVQQMSSNHLVLCCSKCMMFQVQQNKKSAKWVCKVCSTKQSILKVFAEATARECRGIVQHLNKEAVSRLSHSSGQPHCEQEKENVSEILTVPFEQQQNVNPITTTDCDSAVSYKIQPSEEEELVEDKSRYRLSISPCRSLPRDRFLLSANDSDRLYRASLYIFAGLIDTHANWSFVAAYKFTSVTSIQLLDCLTIPVAVLLSIIFLRTRFFWTHYAAVIICLAGAGGMVATDVLVNPTGPQIPMNGSGNTTVPDESSSNVILGDFLVIVGSVAYAASNVLQQYLVIRYGFVDFLAFVSLAALVPTAIYSLTLERAALFSIFSGSASSNHALIFGCLAGYVAAMFSLYSLMPYVLAKTSAVLVNLSLLTADVYALLMGIYLFHYGFHVLYLLCFSVILFGVGLFSCRAPMTRQTHLSCLSCLSERSVCEVTVVQDVLGSKRTPI
ncbi:solute carrier family 35 member F1 [Clonorchis sinensis]|uniref:Solute carrier family 35 member F1 n=1 Tax=Clonorchis sinensis TaxID=79923 RepID=G7YQ01_CLOSI|nr:solute carrier family 35 member F1 [Clonorchis sinensis]